MNNEDNYQCKRDIPVKLFQPERVDPKFCNDLPTTECKPNKDPGAKDAPPLIASRVGNSSNLTTMAPSSRNVSSNVSSTVSSNTAQKSSLQIGQPKRGYKVTQSRVDDDFI